MTLNAEITLGCAFRYALGRMTYVVDSVASEMELHADELSIDQRVRYIREINEAIEKNNAGMQMDVERWIKCRDLLQTSLNNSPLYSGNKKRGQNHA